MSHRYRYYKAYFRFQNVVVPQGATIDSAYIKLNWEGGEEVDFLVVENKLTTKKLLKNLKLILIGL